MFGRLGLIATAQAYGFGAEWENVRRGPEFERQWKGRGLVASLVQGPCTDVELTRQVQTISADTLWSPAPWRRNRRPFHRLLYDFLMGVEEELPDVVQV